jgi:MoxR-like ATPase
MTQHQISISEARQQIRALSRALQRLFVGRSEAIDIILLSALASEPLLLLGAPGTAKTAIVKAFAAHIGLAQGELFDYLITRYTEPSEILGPVDLKALRGGRYLRRTQGKLPTAIMAFFDEIFSANSAILNTLLSILNERIFYQDGQPEPVATEIFIAASNYIADDPELYALRDRFLLKLELEPVKHHLFDQLLRTGMIQDIDRRNRRPIAPLCSLDTFRTLREHIDADIYRYCEQDLDDPLFPAPIRRMFERMLFALDGDGYAQISDRSAIKLYRIIRFHAFVFGSGEVQSQDLFLFAYTPARQELISPLRQRVTALLQLEDPQR